MKTCLSCGKLLPTGAILCVFCKARQRPEDTLDPTPPVMSVAQILAQPKGKPAEEPATVAAPLTEPEEAQAAGGTATAATPPRELSAILRLPAWNRSERASLTAAGCALLLWALAYDRRLLALAMALALLAAGLLPIPRLARGGLALFAGLLLLARPLGLVTAFALVLLPGALLTRAKDPASKSARLIALAGLFAVLALYFVPREGVSPARAILTNLSGDVDLANILRAAYMALPAPLCVVAILAVLPRRTAGGCVLWATLALLWFPVGLLLALIWQGSPPGGFTGAVATFLYALAMLGCTMAASLGIADLAAGESGLSAVSLRRTADESR